MTHIRNTDGLRNSAQQKSQLALERTNNAINQMVSSGQKINFSTVSEVAGVSVAYLYKHLEIKQRIDHLRKPQSPIQGLQQLPGASEDSKKAIITTLNQRIKRLEGENRELANHIEIIHGIALQVPDLNQQIQTLKQENSKLREQLNLAIASPPINQPSVPKGKVTSLTDKKAARSIINNEIKSELEHLGVRVNSTLTKLIKTAPSNAIQKAVEALKEAKALDRVKNPAGFLVEAIRNAWIPNEGYEQKVELETFNEWYPLALSLGLVVAATQWDGLQHVLTKQQKWIPFSQMLALYPLEKLQEISQ